MKKSLITFALLVVSIGIMAQETDCPVMDQAVRLTHEGKLKESIPIYSQAIQQFPNRVEYRIARAYANDELGAWKEAFEDYSMGIKMDPSNVDHFYLRALLAFKMNRLQIAKSDLLKTISMEPTNADAYFVMGKIAWKNKHVKSAEKWFHKAIAQSIVHVDALCGLALLAAQKKQWIKAKSLVDRANKSEYKIAWLHEFEVKLQKHAYKDAYALWFKQSMPAQLNLEVN
jgi:tetratricopeptide (TPR) repeat protein